jgi:nucleoid-associated protein YgaU
MAKVTVQPGDTLSHIALRHLGDVSRWPEVFRLNEAAILTEQSRYEARRSMRGPHWIFPGQRLDLPAA